MSNRQTTLYCHELPNHKKDGTWFAHFYPHPNVTKMCGPEPVLKVNVVETEKAEGCYWGWWENEDNAFTHVYPMKSLVDMCFPYGYEAAEAKGQGKLTPVRIEVLERPGDEK